MLIRNATLPDGRTGVDLLVRDGRIAAVGEQLFAHQPPPADVELIDAELEPHRSAIEGVHQLIGRKHHAGRHRVITVVIVQPRDAATFASSLQHHDSGIQTGALMMTFILASGLGLDGGDNLVNGEFKGVQFSSESDASGSRSTCPCRPQSPRALVQVRRQPYQATRCGDADGQASQCHQHQQHR